MARPRLFVSAVSRELGSARRQVAATLRTLGFDPVTQEDFPTGHGELRAWLEQQIDGCQGVIQLLGTAYGAEPPASADPQRPWPLAEFGRVSYTQYELLYARRRGKPTWLFTVGDGFPRDNDPTELDRPDDATLDAAAQQAEQAECHALQRAYGERLRAGNHLFHPVDDFTQLDNHVLRLRDPLEALRIGELRRQRRLQWGLATVFLTLVLGVAGIVKVVHDRSGQLQQQIAENGTVNEQRVRAHLIETVEQHYQRELQNAAQLSTGTERERARRAAEAQRERQLQRVAELAAGFTRIARGDNASRVFLELNRILAEEGVDAALAYIEGVRAEVLEAARRQRREAEEQLRAELQPLLQSAGLYHTRGDYAEAGSLYRQVLEIAPDWPDANQQAFDSLIAAGRRHIDLGQLPAARQRFDEAAVLADRLAALAPQSLSSQRPQAEVATWIGDVKSAQGDLAGALAAFEQGLEIRRTLAEADPSHAGWQRDLFVSHWLLARLAERKQDNALALVHWRRALERLERLDAAGLHVSPSDRELMAPIRQRIEELEGQAADPAGAGPA